MEKFLDVVIAAASVGVVLGIMILVHEWGHFIAAKSFGVRVEIFSIGFGPRLWGRKRGDTDYRLSALPLGGYVKMAGDNPVEDRAGAPDEFLSKPRWQRAIIALAGPTMNIIMAVLLIAALLMAGLPQPAYESMPAVVVGVPPGSPAQEAGIQPGDRIIEFNGVNEPTWGQVILELQLAAVMGKVSLTLERDGERIPVTVPISLLQRQGEEFYFLGYPEEPVIVDQVSPEMPAEKAGLEPGDILLEANGTPLRNRVQLTEIIQQTRGEPLELKVKRGEETFTSSLKPLFTDSTPRRWMIGIGFRNTTQVTPYSLTEALPRAVWFNVRMTRTILGVIANLFQGNVSIKQLEGPVGIARQSGQAAQMGIIPFVFLMAVISLNLGVLNLLPIPILDGGHLLMLAVEGTIRRDLSVAVKERFVQVGLVFLLLVFAIVMYNDVLKLFTR